MVKLLSINTKEYNNFFNLQQVVSMKNEPLIVEPDQEGQRIDNFLLTRLKGLPKSRLYKALRTGEVRVNQKRVKPFQRLHSGDLVRVPPLRLALDNPVSIMQSRIEEISKRILFEDDKLIIIDKLSGIPVHGGSGIDAGLIEILRQRSPSSKFLELIHRLDRETSGCLLIAKKRQILLFWQDLLARRTAQKQYLALVKGKWRLGTYRLEAPLQKNILKSGERMVVVHPEGKQAITLFHPLKCYSDATLLEIKLLTGRTHQIRVHAASLGYPVAGDEKYGDKEFNKLMRKKGLKRLFLHSASISSAKKVEEKDFLAIGVILSVDLKQVLSNLD